jgi:hypothetical protein
VTTLDTSGADSSGSLIPANWDVPAVFRRRLGDRVGRQRAMVADGHLLLVLHRAPALDEHERRGRLFWRHPDGKWHSPNAIDGTQALTAHLNEYQKQLEKLDAREAKAASSSEYFEVLSELTPFGRAARNQSSVMQGARGEFPDARELINFRDRAYEIERNAELLQADCKTALDYLIARQAEEQAQTTYHMAQASHRLNVLVAFFFPIATLSTVFGTNMVHGLETLNPPVPFLVTLAAGLLIGIILKIAITHEPKRPGQTQKDGSRP